MMNTAEEIEGGLMEGLPELNMGRSRELSGEELDAQSVRFLAAPRGGRSVEGGRSERVRPLSADARFLRGLS